MADAELDAMTDEQLEAALAAGVVPEPAPPEPEPPPVDPTPEAEAAPPEPEAAAPAEPEKPEPTEAELLAQEMEAKAKKWESIAGRNAGELGFIKARLRALQEAQQQRPPQEFGENGEPQERPPSAPSSEVKAVLQWAVQQAVSQTVSGFEASHPDVSELKGAIADYIKSTGYDFNSVLQMDNPIEAQREAGRALEEAYWHTKAAAVSAKRAELSARRQADQMKAATTKLKAGVSGTASTPPPKPREKTVDEMTDKELEDAMVRAQQGRW